MENLTFETKYDEKTDWTRVIVKINDRTCAYITSYTGKPDDLRNEDEIIAYKEQMIILEQIFDRLEQAETILTNYKDEANDEPHEDVCAISIHLLNHIIEFMQDKFQYNDDVARILSFQARAKHPHRMDLILDAWQELTFEQMDATNPIAFAKSMYEFQELNANEIKDLLYKMYNAYILKSNCR